MVFDRFAPSLSAARKTFQSDVTRRVWSFVDDEIRRAEHSPVHRRALSRLLSWVIPFNRPHGLVIETLDPTRVEVSLPFTRTNQNHVGGLHACALATCAEFSCGILLLRHFPSEQFRLLMRKMEVEYHRQGRSTARARCTISTETLEGITRALDAKSYTMVDLVVEVFDRSDEKLCTATVSWQLRRWDTVR
jgi:acyl-coenzyme A thioesterase PaaI-like protein